MRASSLGVRRFRPGSDDPGRFPTGTCQANLPVVRYGPFGGSLRSRRTFEESGIGLRLTLLLLGPSAASVACFPEGKPPASAVAAFRFFLPSPEVRSSSRNHKVPGPADSDKAILGDSACG